MLPASPAPAPAPALKRNAAHLYRRARRLIALPAASVIGACAGVQSALDPAAHGAARIATLFWWLTGGAVVVWIVVMGLAVYAVRSRSETAGRRASLLIIGGGAVVPTVVLAGYLVYGLAMMPDLLRRAPPGTLRIAVTGEQWWWRVRYTAPDGGEIVLANEVRLPVGAPAEFLLDSPDVIHSFWIPSLGGKMDMIPGRVNRMLLEPTRTGTFRGVCAEYCGMSHALMAFSVVVMERREFDRWLTRQAAPAQPPATPLAARGATLFLASGCGACHTVRGTPAEGVVGPDLTHAGSRLSLGAGTLPNDHGAFLRWIATTGAVKPGVHMPSFGMLPRADLRALAAYLEGLQ